MVQNLLRFRLTFVDAVLLQSPAAQQYQTPQTLQQFGMPVLKLFLRDAPGGVVVVVMVGEWGVPDTAPVRSFS